MLLDLSVTILFDPVGCAFPFRYVETKYVYLPNRRTMRWKFEVLQASRTFPLPSISSYAAARLMKS